MLKYKEAKKIFVKKLKLGTILRGKIFDTNENLLFSSKVIITSDIITLLSKLDVDIILFYPESIEINLVYDEESLEEQVIILELKRKYSDSHYQVDILKAVLKSIRNLIHDFVQRKDYWNLSFCQEIYKELFSIIKSNPFYMMNLIRIKIHDDYTFFHSIHIAVISSSISYLMDINRSDCIKIGIAGLLHDLGKIAVPTSFLNKISQLTELESKIIRSHPENSYQLLKLNQSFDPLILRLVIEHHERYDGNGYPKGLSQNQIHEYSTIVSLCDVFDALITVRPYKKALSPKESIQIIEKYKEVRFDPVITDRFIQTIIKIIELNQINSQ